MIRRFALVGTGRYAIEVKGESISRWGRSRCLHKSTTEDRWLSVDEIAVYLGIKRDTVYKWIDRKSMPAHKVGSLWKFKKEEIDDWVRSGEASDRRAGHGDD